MAAPSSPAAGAAHYEHTKALAVDGTKTLLIRHVAIGVLSLVGSTYLIRSLGPERWASLSIAYYLVVVLDQLYAGNLLGQVVRSPTPPGHREIDAAAWLMRYVCLGMLVAFAALSVPVADLYGRAELAYCLVAVGVCGLFYGGRSLPVCLLERRLDYRWIAAGDIVDQIVFYGVAFALIEGGFGLRGAAAALAVRGLLPMVLLRSHCPVPVLGRMHRDALADVIAFGLPSVGVVVVLALSGLVPAIVLGGSRATELAFVMTSGTIISYALTLLVVVRRVGFPSFAALQHDRPRLQSATDRVLALTNFSVISIVVPVASTSPLWLPVAFGDEWKRAGMVMVTIGAGLMAATIGEIAAPALSSLGRARDSFALYLLATVSYLPLAYGFVHVSVLLGVGIAYAVSRALGSAYGVVLLHRQGLAPAWVPRAVATVAGIAVMVAVARLLETGHAGVGLGLLLGTSAVWLALTRGELLMLMRTLSRDAGARQPSRA